MATVYRSVDPEDGAEYSGINSFIPSAPSHLSPDIPPDRHQPHALSRLSCPGSSSRPEKHALPVRPRGIAPDARHGLSVIPRRQFKRGGQTEDDHLHLGKKSMFWSIVQKYQEIPLPAGPLEDLSSAPGGFPSPLLGGQSRHANARQGRADRT